MDYSSAPHIICSAIGDNGDDNTPHGRLATPLSIFSSQMSQDFYKTKGCLNMGPCNEPSKLTTAIFMEITNERQTYIKAM